MNPTIKSVLNCLLYILLIFSLIGCSQKEGNLAQQSESKEAELTLPQIPKLSGPYKPTNKDIQIALKNAGLYNGKVDGNIGPETIKAIREFQAKNNLVVDGKVGPKTWAALKKYLDQHR